MHPWATRGRCPAVLPQTEGAIGISCDRSGGVVTSTEHTMGPRPFTIVVQDQMLLCQKLQCNSGRYMSRSVRLAAEIVKALQVLILDRVSVAASRIEP